MIDEQVLIGQIKTMFRKEPGQEWKAEEYNNALIDVMAEVNKIVERAGSLV